MKKLSIILALGVAAFACSDRRTAEERDLDYDDDTEIVTPDDDDDDTLNLRDDDDMRDDDLLDDDDDGLRSDTSNYRSPNVRDTVK